MSELAYSRASLLADLLRSGAGIALTGLPLLVGAPPTWLAVVLAGLLMLFLTHFVSTVRRSRQRYRLDDGALHQLPRGITIEWTELDEMHLDYFSTRRDGRAGWMQLRLRAGDRTLRVDSGLSGFDRVLKRAVQASGERGLDLSPSTSANLAFIDGESDAQR